MSDEKLMRVVYISTVWVFITVVVLAGLRIADGSNHRLGTISIGHLLMGDTNV